MAVVLQPWQILVATFAGWIARHQDAVLEYLREEDRVLEQQIGRNLTDPTDGFSAEKKYLQIVRLPHRSPNLNAYAEPHGAESPGARQPIDRTGCP